MNSAETSYGRPFPRSQAQLFVELLSRPESALRAALLGFRREGKSDLLRQVHALLFQKAEGPLPFYFSFEAGKAAGSAAEKAEKDVSLARRFVAAFCQQMRAFVMRQEEQLGEPLARIESELDRPGLPLALTELGREFLSLPPAEQPEFAAAMPAKFAQSDGRPLCLLLDDADLSEAEPYLSGLRHARLSWLITGRAPIIKRIAAERSWQVLRLEPFAPGEALSLAEERCREFEMRFSREAWENWFDLAGASPWLVEIMLQAASAAASTLDSVEAFGRIYVRELAAGTFSTWLEGRWKRALAKPSSGTAAAVDGKQAARVAEQLLAWDSREASSAAAIPPAVWEGLVTEEWAEETGFMDRPRLGMIERDWLQLLLAPERAGSGSAQAGALQAFLLRAEHARQWGAFSDQVTELRHGLSGLPQSAPSATASRGHKEFRLPLVCSVAVERVPTAELYWCYGFRPDWPQERRDRTEAACVYLIALCREQPAAAEVKQWSKRLQETARTLPATAGQEGASAGLSPRYEFWLALPRGAPLTSVAGEKRLRWEALASLLEEKKPQPGLDVPPRLRELDARAQWLEEELATAREQFDLEARQLSPLHTEAAAHAEPSTSGSEMTGAESTEVHSRLALSLNLLQVSSDLLALQSSSDPAALDAIKQLQQKAQQLAEMLRAHEWPSPPESQGREVQPREAQTKNPKNPSSTAGR